MQATTQTLTHMRASAHTDTLVPQYTKLCRYEHTQPHLRICRYACVHEHSGLARVHWYPMGTMSKALMGSSSCMAPQRSFVHFCRERNLTKQSLLLFLSAQALSNQCALWKQESSTAQLIAVKYKETPYFYCQLFPSLFGLKLKTLCILKSVPKINSSEYHKKVTIFPQSRRYPHKHKHSHTLTQSHLYVSGKSIDLDRSAQCNTEATAGFFYLILYYSDWPQCRFNKAAESFVHTSPQNQLTQKISSVYCLYVPFQTHLHNKPNIVYPQHCLQQKTEVARLCSLNLTVTKKGPTGQKSIQQGVREHSGDHQMDTNCQNRVSEPQQSAYLQC